MSEEKPETDKENSLQNIDEGTLGKIQERVLSRHRKGRIRKVKEEKYGHSKRNYHRWQWPGQISG